MPRHYWHLPTHKTLFAIRKATFYQLNENEKINLIHFFVCLKWEKSKENTSMRVSVEGDLASVQEFGVPFMETSAKSGLNVELAFTAVAKWVTRFPETGGSFTLFFGQQPRPPAQSPADWATRKETFLSCCHLLCLHQGYFGAPRGLPRFFWNSSSLIGCFV